MKSSQKNIEEMEKRENPNEDDEKWKSPRMKLMSTTEQCIKNENNFKAKKIPEMKKCPRLKNM